MAEKQELTWNGSDYTCEYQGGTLYVSGDAWAKARLERAMAYFQERHPDLGKEEVKERFAGMDREEAEECEKQAMEELLDPDAWAGLAVEVNEDGEPLEPIGYSPDAWITKQ